jgi:branched-chain amino acid transport system permease protein
MVETTLNGILLGGVYALMAQGMALVWGVMNVVNIAHGALLILGSYLTFWAFLHWGLDPLLAMPLSMTALFLLGYLLQRLLINRVVRAEIFFTLLVTFGIEILMMNVMAWGWSVDPRRVNPSYSFLGLSVGPYTIPLVRVVAFGMALVVTFLLFYFLQKTQTGRSIRATAQDVEAARLCGIPVAQVYGITYAIGAALAAAAGSLMAMLFSFTPYSGGAFTLKSFVVCVLGGLENAWGPLLGGVVLGVMEELGSRWFGSTYREAISFGLLVVILLLRPSGLLGRRE